MIAAPAYRTRGIAVRDAGMHTGFTMFKVVFTDLDGTLLDRFTYSWEPAAPALSALRRAAIPVVLSTSKTRAEVEHWRAQLGIDAPFIVENGGAVYLPRGYFDFVPPDSRVRGDCDVIEFGVPYPDLVTTLNVAAEETSVRVLGFSAMTVEEIAARTHLPRSLAALAKMREYDEPFEVLDGGAHRLLNAIEARGKRCSRGDRYYHITGGHDKSVAVACLRALFAQTHGDVRVIGLGDAWNDAAFLKSVDVAVVIRSQAADALHQEVPAAMVTRAPGPHGWAEAITAVLRQGAGEVLAVAATGSEAGAPPPPPAP